MICVRQRSVNRSDSVLCHHGRRLILTMTSSCTENAEFIKLRNSSIKSGKVRLHN